VRLQYLVEFCIYIEEKCFIELSLGFADSGLLL